MLRVEDRTITCIDKEKWNSFVANSPSCSILQSYEWGELKARFGWQPVRLALEEGGRIRAGISILKRSIPLIKHSLFYAPRGPIADFSDRELMHGLMAAVEKEAERDRAISLKIDPEITDPSTLHSLGFEKAMKQVQPRATMVIDLLPELDQLLAGFEEKTRYNVRLAQKKGVQVREDPSQQGIDIFCRLYLETAHRDKFMIHPPVYYRKIREIIFAAGLGTNFIAYYDDIPIAAVMVFNFGKKVWYMYGASSALYRKVMPNHILHWEVIKWAKQKGLEQYDLWGIPAALKPEHPLYGVYRFKKGFNGRTVKYVGAYDFPFSPMFYHAFEYGVIFWQGLRSLLSKGKIEDSLGE
jgi:peptidoglycan pentaglycine glycine transferase (the first glycine)